MAGQLNFAKVISLPSTLEANTIYLLKDPQNIQFMKFYITDDRGQNIYRMPGLSDINAGVSTRFYLFSNLNSLQISTPPGVAIAWVMDTTGDPNTNGMPAPYVYVPSSVGGSWMSMFNLNYLSGNISWDDFNNGPQSSPAEIDAVVNWWKQYHATLTGIDEAFDFDPTDAYNVNVWQQTYGGMTEELDNYWQQYGGWNPY
jgi:hypothetical protein